MIIAGGREFNDYTLLVESCDKLLANKQPNIEIVNGGANGADRLGGKYAIQKGYKMKPFHADWDDVDERADSELGRKNGRVYWKYAGHARNLEMAQYADAAIVFWDGASTGTKNMIDSAKEEGITVKVVRYD